MKLTNPSDDQLNAAFAENVAGWTRYGPNKGEKRSVICRLCGPERGQTMLVWKDGKLGGCYPDWAGSADAVLPWLEKMGEFSQYYHKSFPDAERWSVGVDRHEPHGTGWAGYAKAETFSRATTIAILRAHGVEIEFTA